MRELTITISLWFVIIITVLCWKMPTVEMEEPSPVVEEVEVVTPAPEPEVTPQPWTDEEVIVLAKMLWSEAGSVASDTEKAAVIWCALNHVEAGYGNGSIVAAVTIPGHFVGYSKDNPVDESLKALCEDVLSRYFAEKQGQINVGRVLPQDYLYFSGDGYQNHFRNEYRGGSEWDWSLPSPYES